MPDRGAQRIEQVILMVMVCAGIAGFGAAYGQQPAWAFWFPCLLSIFWRIRHVPAGAQIAARIGAHLFEVLALILGLIFMAYPVLAPETATRLTLIAGYGLCFFATLFLLGSPVWDRATSFFPAAVGLLVVDCYNPLALIRPLLAGGALAVFAYLALPMIADGLRKVAAAQWARLAVFLTISAGIAAATIVLLPLLQSQVEQATFQMFLSAGQGYSGLSTTAHLGDLEQLKLSPRVALRVWSSRAQDLRARAYSRFDGRNWTANPGAGSALRPVPDATIPAAGLRDWLDAIPGSSYEMSGTTDSTPLIFTRIVPAAMSEGLLVSPGNKAFVRGELASVRVDAQENLQPPTTGAVGIYGSVNHAGDLGQPGKASPKEIEEALQLPADTDPRFRVLAARLAEGATSAEEKIRRTLALVSTECRYSLAPGKFRTKQPVAEFLFEKKIGYCQYFASAAAVLLRLQGVPTRYVSGFHVTEEDRMGDHYVVRDLDAHAWIESYVPGKGWVASDPTPAAEYQALHSGLRRGWIASVWERTTSAGSEAWVWLRRSDWRSSLSWMWRRTRNGLPWIVLALMVAALAWLARTFTRRKKAIPIQVPASLSRLDAVESTPELSALMQRVERCWSECGCPRPPHRGPQEHLVTVPADKLTPAARRSAEQVVEAYYRCSFGGVRVPNDEIAALQRECAVLEQDRVAVRRD